MLVKPVLLADRGRSGNIKLRWLVNPFLDNQPIGKTGGIQVDSNRMNQGREWAMQASLGRSASMIFPMALLIEIKIRSA